MAAKLERRQQPLLGFRPFVLRMFRYSMFSGALIFVSLLLGIAGYRWIGKLGWVDSILNASFILTGMGPVDRMDTTAAKLFASVYALFSGVIFFSAVGVLLTPAFHRVLHRFHLDIEEGGGRRRSGE